MLFNSYEFIFLFLPITFVLYFYLNNKRLTVASKGLLVASSLFFYSWWNVLYLPLILISMLLNYVLGASLTGKQVKQNVSRRGLLFVGVSGNLLLLGYFKYTDFLIENVNFLFGTHLQLLSLALPLGISFFTFQQIAYLVDSYRNETEEYDFLNYTVFVSFFPQLIAGPIVHHKEMMPQFDRVRNKVICKNNIARGIFIFSIGLFKKVALADMLSVWASNGFDKADVLSFVEAWATSLAYTAQLYFDFSGYTDMAIGAALLFNIELPINFWSPYKSTNIKLFWRRWHITLSRFLKDYIYVPLGGNRRGEFRTCANLMITFLLGGIWHGAGWTFIFWGFLHGFALIIHRVWSKWAISVPKIVAWLITFLFVNVTWIFFRARDWAAAVKVLRGMAGLDGIILPSALAGKLAFMKEYGIEFGGFVANINGSFSMLFWILVALLIALIPKNSIQLKDESVFGYKTAIMSGLIFAYAILSMNRVTEFLYFNF